MNILSIQSSVAYGHAGNSSAVFPLQRLGHEVWPVYTVHFSNHTGYGEWRGPVFEPETVRDVITGIEERGVLDAHVPDETATDPTTPDPIRWFAAGEPTPAEPQQISTSENT